MRRQVSGPALGVALALTLLAGCASSVADAVYPGSPDGVTISGSLDGPAAGWITEGERFAVVTMGSSSCPVVATELTVVAADQLALTFGRSPNNPCTGDLAPTTHEFDLPADIVERPVQIDVTYEHGDWTATLTLD